MCFSRFIFFLLMIYFLLFILYLFWTMEMILDKSIVEWFSYLSLKRVIKQQKQLSTLTMHLAQELLRNVQCSGGSRSSAKRTRALKIRIAVDSHWKLITTDWDQSLKLMLLQLYEKLPKKMLTIWRSFSIWSKLERWQNSLSGCLMSWPKIKKIKQKHNTLFFGLKKHTLWIFMLQE